MKTGRIAALAVALAATATTFAQEPAPATQPVLDEPQAAAKPSLRYAHGRITRTNLEPMPPDWRHSEQTPWIQPADPRHVHPETGQLIVPIEDRYLAKPLVDEPMRNPSICRGPDGTFYLIGATPRKMDDGSLNWNYGHEIRMWKSADLESWEKIGVVWDLNTPKWSPEHGNNMGWLQPPRGGGFADSFRHTWNVTAPRIYYLRDTFWIAFSVGDQGTGLLKSESGKAEGPYILWGDDGVGQGRITMTGTEPSLFVDDDGSAYWLWSPAWIARMKEDLSGLAEPPRLLTCEPAYGRRAPNQSDILVGRRGPALFKANGVYHLAAAELTHRLGIQVEDTLVATSKELFGPYSKRVMMIKHGGPTSVFQDGDGKHWATVCGSDRYAAVRDRAGIVPLDWVTRHGWRFNLRDGVLIAHPLKVFTERGPWHKMLPLFVKPGLYIRDHHVMQAPDGYFYVSGSVHGEPYHGKLPIFRSRDLKEWEEIIVRTFEDEEELTPEAKRYRGVRGDEFNVGDWGNYYMSTSVNWVPKLKTFAINYEVWTKPKGTRGILLSTSGRGEGPYRRVGPGFNCGKFFEDDDGRFYMTWGCNGLNELNEDFTVKERLPGPLPPSGAKAYEDSGCAMIKMFGQYIYLTITCKGGTVDPAKQYGWGYMQADQPTGPWGEWMPGFRHAAWGQPFRGLDGHWYASSFQPALTPLTVVLYRLKTELRDGRVYVDIDPDWTPDDYVPVTEWKGKGTWSPYTDTAVEPAGE